MISKFIITIFILYEMTRSVRVWVVFVGWFHWGFLFVCFFHLNLAVSYHSVAFQRQGEDFLTFAEVFYGETTVLMVLFNIKLCNSLSKVSL